MEYVVQCPKCKHRSKCSRADAASATAADLSLTLSLISLVAGVNRAACDACGYSWESHYTDYYPVPKS